MHLHSLVRHVVSAVSHSQIVRSRREQQAYSRVQTFVLHPLYSRGHPCTLGPWTLVFPLAADPDTYQGFPSRRRTICDVTSQMSIHVASHSSRARATRALDCFDSRGLHPHVMESGRSRMRLFGGAHNPSCICLDSEITSCSRDDSSRGGAYRPHEETAEVPIPRSSPEPHHFPPL